MDLKYDQSNSNTLRESKILESTLQGFALATNRVSNLSAFLGHFRRCVTISPDSVRLQSPGARANWIFFPPESGTFPWRRHSAGHASVASSARPVAPTWPGASSAIVRRSRVESWANRTWVPCACGPPSSLGPCLQIECTVSRESEWESLENGGRDREGRKVGVSVQWIGKLKVKVVGGFGKSGAMWKIDSVLSYKYFIECYLLEKSYQLSVSTNSIR